MLAPFEAHGNRLSREYYKDLKMPWQCGQAAHFAQENFKRIIWDEDGKPSAPDGTFLQGNKPTTLENLAAGLGSASMVQRWRAAHPAEAHTDADCVNITIKEMRDALGSDEVIVDGATVLLLFTKS